MLPDLSGSSVAMLKNDAAIETVQPRRYVFCGVGGSGMSALAVMMAARGHDVIGTDRSYDRGQSPEKFERLQHQNITLLPQDGSALNTDIDYLVISSAVEDSIPDVMSAKEHDVRIIKRADLLATLFNASDGVAIAGTSGKTTVTAMVGHILHQAGIDPTIINGGLMANFPDENGAPRNIVSGHAGVLVAEVDESDGSIAAYDPYVALLNNIAEDHKPLPELKTLFGDYLARARRGVVVNADDDLTMALCDDVSAQRLTFSAIDPQADFYVSEYAALPSGLSFSLHTAGRDHAVRMAVPGRHNMMNAAAAIAVCSLCGVPVETACQAVSDFRGTHRRLEVVGQIGDDITVIDDFAHNPDKITASLQAMRDHDGRVLVIFQPHGFGPMKMMRDGIVDAVAQNLRTDDLFMMPEIYDAGGTADRTISSVDLIDDIKARGVEAYYFKTRDDIVPFVQQQAKSGDRILVMGARDDTLTDFCRDILAALE